MLVFRFVDGDEHCPKGDRDHGDGDAKQEIAREVGSDEGEFAVPEVVDEAEDACAGEHEVQPELIGVLLE